MYGPHLVLEGYRCKNSSLLADKSTILNMLGHLPSAIDMTIIMPPRVMEYDGGSVAEESGVSGFVIIAESHIAIHTYPHKGFFTLDIFSCKSFEIQKAIDYVVELFAPEKYDYNVFDRGREFPHSTERAVNIVSAERTKFDTKRPTSLTSA
ncbi:MAG TPA: adenosylmethionine decarboxylase [Vampirovibrionales bacterium]